MRRRFVLPTLAVGAVLLTALLPLSGWLVRTQLKVAFGAGMEQLAVTFAGSHADTDAQYKAASKRDSDDFLLQLGFALRKTDGPERRAAILTLAPRFGKEAALWGVLLNSKYSGENSTVFVVPGSPADKGEPWRPPKDAPWDPNHHSDPATVAEVLAAARSGEQLDPTNAFFPMMEAYALLADQKADAALEAVRHAGTKSRFEDYGDTEVRALWRLTEVAFGETGSLARATISASMLFGTSASLRQVARSVNSRAMALEQDGNAEAGLELRGALLRVSTLMMGDDATFLNNLVGRAIGAIAQARPGGTPRIDKKGVKKPGMSMSDDEVNLHLQSLRAEGFANYTAQHGHPELGELAKAQADAFRKQQEAWKRANAIAPLGIPGMQYGGICLVISLLFLFSALWTIFFGGIAFALGRTERIRRGESLHPAVRWGLALTLAPILIAIGRALSDPFAQILLPMGALALIAGAFLHLRRASFDEKLTHRIGLMLVTTLGTLAMIFLAGLLVIGPVAFSREIISQLGLRSTDPQNNDPGLLGGLIAGLICLVIPLTAIIDLAIRSGKKELPASVGIVRGFRRIAIPMASILLLIYAGSAIGAAWVDAHLRAELRESVQHEGRYIARIAGMEYPFLKE